VENLPAELMVDTDAGQYPWPADAYRPRIDVVRGGVEILAGHAAGAVGYQRFLREQDYPRVVVLRWGYNSRKAATISGPAVAWSYADGHGMEMVAVLRRGESFRLWVPGSHSHGPGQTWYGAVGADGVIEWERELAPAIEV